MRLYTIYFSNKPWENVIDDMNTTEIWAMGSMLWTSRKKAEACMKHLQNPEYRLESEARKFKIVALKPLLSEV